MKARKILTRALKILGMILLSLFIVSVFFALRWWGESRFDYRSYPTYDAAVTLPHSSFMPPSATDIRYIGHFEASEIWLFFNFDIKEISEIRKYCGRVTEGEIELAPDPPGDFIDWPEEITRWPEEITRYVFAISDRAEDIAGYEFYRCEYGTREESLLGINTGILSVDTENGKAYYWGPH